jgi:hypothetical protein
MRSSVKRWIACGLAPKGVGRLKVMKSKIETKGKTDEKVVITSLIVREGGPQQSYICNFLKVRTPFFFVQR